MRRERRHGIRSGTCFRSLVSTRTRTGLPMPAWRSTPKGFVVTGKDGMGPLETNVPGLFAVGDIRSGSIKRVAASVGEGAQVVAALHLHFAEKDRLTTSSTRNRFRLAEPHPVQAPWADRRRRQGGPMAETPASVSILAYASNRTGDIACLCDEARPVLHLPFSSILWYMPAPIVQMNLQQAGSELLSTASLPRSIR